MSKKTQIRMRALRGGALVFCFLLLNAAVARAGLRPITKLEFEKAVRGPNFAELDDADLSFWGLSDVNTQRGDKIWQGDAMQVGLVTPKGLHYNMALALTTNGVVLHLFTEANDALIQGVDCRVARDDKAAVTRYALRLPLTIIGLAAGDTLGFNIMFCDADDNKGLRQSIRMTQGISYPFKTELYPRFVLEK